ncbi:RNA pseudouridine synthase 1 [Selaginella moellendorffii]|uniref:RNA pseudouridine synthase 1 n=1 Tax=Selaginella moellendorffii TaxID=88036 RepID=UPI000D1C6D8C|nr:RNA pseudouridine synthase 1 [Selaginella moellendorffii]|eukprot:XP_024544097.1 RNA pseudouridine synthase 1 [Selaginella moellendorffii]
MALFHYSCFPRLGASAATPSSASSSLPFSRSAIAVAMAAPSAVESQECGEAAAAAIDLSRYPIPVTPLTGAKEIEYERALVAEASMKSGPAITIDDVVFQDEWILVINKPCGVYSEHVLVSVPSLLGDSYSPQYPIEKSRGFFHLANRLDRDTSGIIVIARDKVAAGKLTNIFKSRELRKSYVALCVGKAPHWKRAVIESGHGKSRRGCWRVYSKHDVERSLPDGSVVKDMSTKIEVMPSSLDEAKDSEEDDGEQRIVVEAKMVDPEPGTGDEVFIRAVPLTGRTHQIRLHCQFLGLPLVGDVKYGGPLHWNGEKCQSHFLHSESIAFQHPMTGEVVEVIAPHPSWAASKNPKV